MGGMDRIELAEVDSTGDYLKRRRAELPHGCWRNPAASGGNLNAPGPKAFCLNTAPCACAGPVTVYSGEVTLLKI